MHTAQRSARENCHVLKFGNARFEEERRL